MVNTRLVDEISDKGWTTQTLPLSVVLPLVHDKDEYLRIAFAEVEKAFNVTLDRFDEEKIAEIEIAKSIVKALLRYGKHGAVLAREIATYMDAFPVAYTAYPYPLIHLPLDISERGGRHKDIVDYIPHHYIAWVPLNDCAHGPLAITERTHKKESFLIRQMRLRVPFVDRLVLATKNVVRPHPSLGQFLLWDAHTDHEGMLNTSDATTVALVIAFTNVPLVDDVLGDPIVVSDLQQTVRTLIAAFRGKTKTLSADEMTLFAFAQKIWHQRMDKMDPQHTRRAL